MVSLLKFIAPLIGLEAKSSSGATAGGSREVTNPKIPEVFRSERSLISCVSILVSGCI